MDVENSSEPDSTTLEKDVRQEFRKDEDVLCLNNKDGCFYLGTIVQVDAVYKRCLVEFLDNTTTWSCFKDLKSFAPQESEICYVCKSSQSKSDNKIIVCKCGRSCHQLCHEPKITSTSIADWKCKICVPTTKRKDEKSLPKKTLASSNQPHVFESPLTSVSQLPYSPRRPALEWADLVHIALHNLALIHQTKYYDLEESILPYINKNWDNFKLPPKMAAAALEVRRSSVLHALKTCKKRFKSGSEIKNKTNIWGLRCRGVPKTPVVFHAATERVEDNVLKVSCKKDIATAETESRPLQNGYINSSQVGSRPLVMPKPEHKIVPPLVINVPKPNSTTVSYRVSERGKDAGPKLSDNHVTDFKIISSTEYHGRGLVKRSTPFPVSDQANHIDTRFRSHAVRKARRLLNKNLKRKKKTVEPSVLEEKTNVSHNREENDLKISPMNFSRSFIEFVEKRDRELRKKAKVNPEVRKRPQRNLLEARLNSTESKLYNPFMPVDNSETKKTRQIVPDHAKRSTSAESQSRKKSLKTKANEKMKHGKPKLIQKTIFDSFNIKPNEKGKTELLPVMSKCKLKDPELNSGDSKSNSVKSDRDRKSGGSVRSESLERTQGESDMGVESTDDEASSRGTLEPFIPTPKDFEGHNNPFRTVTELINTAAGVSPSLTVPPITLPLPLKTVIPHADPPRLKKRQLSEKDIIIDRNGQVKRRRRHRRNQAGLMSRALAPGTAAKSAQITPGKNKKHWEKKTLQPLVNNCVDYALNGRQLRTREPVKPPDKQISSAKTTPVKNSPSKDPPLNEDLESSVKYFFGAAGRIASGEKYEIRAKRVTFDGRVQCIIDWKGLPT